jgi:exosortase C (VPDSG-CTERM-specific)
MPSTKDPLAPSLISQGTAAWAAWQALPRPERIRIAGWIAWITAGALAFVRPLAALVVHASENSLHSHILLVPAVTAYLLFLKRRTLPAPGPSAIVPTLLLGAVSAGALVVGLMSRSSLSVNDTLALMAFAYVSFVAAGGFLFLGSSWMARAAFPMAFLIFVVPLPDAAVRWFEDALVLASADVSAAMISATGTPLLRNGTVFVLPTIVLEVARECSGIRSTWVLFITSLVASHMFLHSPWRRFVLVAFVIPLGIIRNGFRILVIALLCVKVGPHMVDSVIHHRGGPIFFAASLVPLFMLMAWLRRRDGSA